VLDVLLVSLLGSCLIVETRLDRIDATAPYPLKPTWGLGEDWLLISHDDPPGPGEERHESHPMAGAGERRVNTIMMLHLRHDGSRPLLVNLPLRTYVVISGHGPGSLGAAYTWGGPQLLIRTLEGITHASVEHYVEIGLGDLASLVDAVGGVRICSGTPARAPAPGISVGCPAISGSRALDYLRRGDSARTRPGRGERQRRLVAALAEKAMSPEMALDPARIIAFVRKAVGAVTVDKGSHVYDLLRLALALRDGAVSAKTVPTVKGGVVPGVGRIVTWDGKTTAELLASIVTDRPEPKGLIPD
jgi:LCP family protein required for cell wall assembly